MAEPLLRLSGVTKRFGSAVALRDVSLDLREGEFVCLLGPSGCGKSTLLRCLAGFESLDGGSVTFAGQDLTRVPPHRRPLNMMFQSYALFPHLTVAGNIAYGLAGLGLSRSERAARLAEMVRLARLEGLEARKPDRLSGGQRQRVALARALARRPRVLLLDEPLAALDRGLRAATGAGLKEVQRRLGTTFVMVTHDQDEALALADRIGIMEGGELVQAGTPREVYDRPASRFVARFLGAANVLAGTIVGRDAGRCRLGLPDGSFIEGETEAPLRPGQPAAAIIRPESITLVPEAGQGGRGRLHGTVQETTFLGSVTDLKVALGCGEVLRVTLPASADPPASGTFVTCAVPPAAVRILP